MDVLINRLYEELRQTEQELVASLQIGPKDQRLAEIFQAELADIHAALKKVECGDYGKCEITGEMLPENILKSVPTIKSVNDCQSLARYYRKPFYLFRGLSFC